MDIDVERVFQAVTERLRGANKIPQVETITISAV
jgi:hypothetical protein